MYFGQCITIYYTENSVGERVQVYVEEKRNSVSELDFEDVISLDPEELVYKKAESKNSVEKKLSKTCVTLLNNSRANLIGNFDVSGNGNLVAIDNDNDGKIDVLDITTYDLYLVKNASAVYNRLTFKNSDKVIELNDYAYCRIIDVSEKDIDIGSINQDSVVEISISKDERFITIKVVNKSITFKLAQISKKSGKDYFVIKSDDGTEY